MPRLEGVYVANSCNPIIHRLPFSFAPFGLAGSRLRVTTNLSYRRLARQVSLHIFHFASSGGARTERAEISSIEQGIFCCVTFTAEVTSERAERYPSSKVGFQFFVSSLSQQRRPREIPITTTHHAWSSRSQNPDYWGHKRDRNGRCQVVS